MGTQDTTEISGQRLAAFEKAATYYTRDARAIVTDLVAEVRRLRVQIRDAEFRARTNAMVADDLHAQLARIDQGAPPP